MSRSSEAAWLRVQLPAETGVPVLVQWTTSGEGQRMRWHIIWEGGPTVDGMTALIDRLLPPDSALDRDEMLYLRRVQPMSVALAVVRNLRMGLDPLGGHPSSRDLERHLSEVPFPERGVADDLGLAAELTRLADGDTHQIAQLADRYRLAGLRDQLAATHNELPDNVLPFRRPPR